jgi:hypothetical protein
MNAYRVRPTGCESYVLMAKSLRHAVAFTHHWPSVTIRRLTLRSTMGGLQAWVTTGWEGDAARYAK